MGDIAREFLRVPFGQPMMLTVVIDQGVAPFAGAGYKTFRNVKDYGARGDGKTDDSAAINAAIMDGNRCGQGCVSLHEGVVSDDLGRD